MGAPIEASPAYQDRGMILVTFDESEDGAESCCGETDGPNTPNNGGPTKGSGGGKVGAVMVSPCIEPGTVSDSDYNHYSMLRWVEDNFGLGHLANAAPAGVGSFGADVSQPARLRPGGEAEGPPAPGAWPASGRPSASACSPTCRSAARGRRSASPATG